MNNSIVTQRFIKCLHKLRETKTVKSSRQFAMELDYLPQSLSEILNGRRDVTIEVVRKAVEIYRLNPVFLFSGEGDMFLNNSPEPADAPAKELRVLTVVTDANDDERIVHVPIPAYAGYVNGYDKPVVLKSMPSFTLPDYKYKVGTHRCFDVAGDAMEPTLFEGDKIVCNYLEPMLWETAIKDSYVYVVVTKDDILVRRVVNNINANGTLKLISDNNFYEPQVTPLSNVNEIWYVRAKISPFLPSPQRVQNLFFDEIQQLKDTLREQSKHLGSMSETISKLVRND